MFAIVALIVALSAPVTGPPIADLPPCLTEDSSNCVWDAQSQGNGEGTSFYDIEGSIHPLATASTPLDDWLVTPTFTCETWQVPGWLNDEGVPTSCVDNAPCPEAREGLPCLADLPAEATEPAEPVDTIEATTPAPEAPAEAPAEVVTETLEVATTPTPVVVADPVIESTPILDVPPVVATVPATPEIIETATVTELAETGPSSSLWILAIGLGLAGAVALTFDYLRGRRPEAE